MLSQARSSKVLSKTGEALVKQFKIDAKAKKIIKKYVPEYVRKHSSIVFATNEIIRNERVEWVWKWNW